MNYVELKTGKIYGCKKGSYQWYHEKGHIEFDKNEKTGRLKLYQNYVFWFWALSTTLSVINKFMIIISIPSILIYIGIEIYEEKWCNDYAKKHFKQ